MALRLARSAAVWTMIAGGIGPAAPQTPPSFSAQRAALQRLCRVFSPCDLNADGTREIEELRPIDLGYTVGAAETRNDTVLLIIEPRLMEESGIDLRPSLRQFAADLATEGHDTHALVAQVYAGPRHQDGRTVLALRELLRAAKRELPDLRGVVLIGRFPEAMIVRQYYWLKQTPIAINAGLPNERRFEEAVEYIRDRAELVAWRSDLILGDLDGQWEAVYHEGRTELPHFLAVCPEGVEAQDSTTDLYEFGTDAFEDFFFVNDGKWRMEAKGEGRIRFQQLPDENDECSPDDLTLPNPLARPDLRVSRVDASHVGLEPASDLVDAEGRGLLDERGLPQTLTFADTASTPRAIGVWRHSEQTERRLLAEYFERNHRFRTGGYAEARKPASFSTEFGSALPELRETFAAWKGFDEPGYDVQGEGATLLEAIRWLKRPAAVRALKAHSDPWGSSVGKTEDAEALKTELGGTFGGWRSEGNQLVPGLLNQDKLHLEYYRALWANGQLPDCGVLYLHTGCESIAPEGAATLPYSHPQYGYWQGAESLLFHANGLALVGRSKVFYDEPRGFFRVLATGGTVGEAWAEYFAIESAATDVDEVGGGIGRKRAYFWSVLGDWTLTVPGGD
ncbi:MAG: hypothetical protein FJX74_07075 [Armatimonadetes bacterium]|nr:hypothetical protein [Armatimonadota bacterium]